MIWLLFKLFYIFVDDLFNQDVSELNINKAVKTNINKFIEKYNNYIYINNTGMQNIDFKVIRDFINEINNYKIINFDSYNK